MAFESYLAGLFEQPQEKTLFHALDAALYQLVPSKPRNQNCICKGVKNDALCLTEDCIAGSASLRAMEHKPKIKVLISENFLQPIQT